MDSIAQLIGLTGAELIQLLGVAIALLIGLFLLRLAFKLTASLIRIGCIGIFLIVGVLFLVQFLSG